MEPRSMHSVVTNWIMLVFLGYSGPMTDLVLPCQLFNHDLHSVSNAWFLYLILLLCRLTIRCLYSAKMALPLQVQIQSVDPPRPVAEQGPLRIELRIAKGICLLATKLGVFFLVLCTIGFANLYSYPYQLRFSCSIWTINSIKTQPC